MEYAFSLAQLIRAGSGLLWLAIGLAAVAMRPATPGGRAMAWLLAAYGARFVAANVWSAALDTPSFLPPLAIEMACAAAVVALAIPAALHFPNRLAMDRRGELAATGALLVIVASLSSLYAVPELRTSSDLRFIPLSLKIADDFLTNLAFAAVLLVGVALAIRLRTEPAGTASAPPGWGALLLGLFVYFAYAFGRFVPGPGVDRSNLQAGGIVIVLWLVAAATGPASRIARNGALGLSGVALAGMAALVLAPEWTKDVGDVGIVRSVGAALVAHAVFRGDVLQLGRRSRLADRGAIATTAFAALLIVAQVAQNYFSAEYGLLMGGVLAGALLFAASPLQQAVERILHRQGPGGETRSLPTDNREHEEMYREAARLALRDRQLARDEERHLFRLARGLGLAPDRAHEILVEVERERANEDAARTGRPD